MDTGEIGGTPDDGLATRIDRVERSAIRTMFDLAADRDSGDLVHLEIGEPDFDTPSHIVEAAHRAATEGKTHYTANAGILELRRAIAETMAEENDVTVDPESELVVTTGAMEALHLSMLAVADAGTEVVIPTPSWPNYFTQAKLADADPVEVPLPSDQGFELEPDRVIEAVDDSTAAVVLASPSNPTGRAHDLDAMERVVAAADDHGAYVIVDSVYEGLQYDGSNRGLAAVTDHPERVLTVNSFSKKYAMTGWRLGWLAGPSTVIDGVTKIRESTTACPATPTQYAGMAALNGPQDEIEAMKRAFEYRRGYVVDRIEAIPGVSAPKPEGAFYAFVDVSEIAGDETSFEVAKRLLREYDLVTAPGEGFGRAGAGHLRLSFANSEENLERGLDRLESFARDRI